MSNILSYLLRPDFEIPDSSLNKVDMFELPGNLITGSLAHQIKISEILAGYMK